MGRIGLGFLTRFAPRGVERPHACGVAFPGFRRANIFDPITRPEAVFRAKDGYLRVEYGKVGVKFQSYDQRTASGGHVPGSSAPTIH